MDNEKRVLWRELGSLNVQIHCNIKAKLKQKPPEVEEAREGKRATGGSTGHHGLTVAVTSGRGVHHGLTVVAAMVAARLFPPCAAFWSFGVSPWAAGFAFSWVFWGLFASFF